MVSVIKYNDNLIYPNKRKRCLKSTKYISFAIPILSTFILVLAQYWYWMSDHCHLYSCLYQLCMHEPAKCGCAASNGRAFKHEIHCSYPQIYGLFLPPGMLFLEALCCGGPHSASGRRRPIKLIFTRLQLFRGAGSGALPVFKQWAAKGGDVAGL